MYGKQECYERSGAATLTSVPMDCIKPFNLWRSSGLDPVNIGPLFVIQIMFSQDKTMRSENSKVLLIIFTYMKYAFQLWIYHLWIWKVLHRLRCILHVSSMNRRERGAKTEKKELVMLKFWDNSQNRKDGRILPKSGRLFSNFR